MAGIYVLALLPMEEFKLLLDSVSYTDGIKCLYNSLRTYVYSKWSTFWMSALFLA